MDVIMKLCLLLLYIFHGITYANPAIYSTIYGVDKINAYHRPMLIPVYVQMGSFSTENAANQYASMLSTKTTYKAQVKLSSKQYKVRVGPFYNHASLNLFAASFSEEHLIEMRTANISGTHSLTKMHQKNWFIGGQIGGQKTDANTSTTVNNGSGFSAPYDHDIYNINAPAPSVLLGLQAGRRWGLSYPWLSALSLGVQYQYFFTSNVEGQITQFSLPQFKNYNTSWQTTANLLIANAKLNFFNYHQSSPYIHGGIGGVFKNTQSYRESALQNVTPRISPNYQNKNDAQFSYLLGAGIDYLVQQHYLLSAGYQYAYLGNLSSGYGTDRWSTQSLNFGNSNSHAFLFSLAYLFDVHK